MLEAIFECVERPEKVFQFEEGGRQFKETFLLDYRSSRRVLEVYTADSVLPELSPEEKFKRRIEILGIAAELSDVEGFPTVFSFGEYETGHYILREFFDTEDLKLWNLNAQSLEDYYHRVAQVLINLTRVVQRGHEKGILHLDIKPENVVVDDDLGVGLFDYDIARRLQIKNGVWQAYVDLDDSYGSPDFISPEVKNHRQASVASDVFCIGATGHDLILGRPPRPKELRRKRCAFSMMSKELYRIVIDCYGGNSTDRPTTDQLIERLEKYTGT